MNQNKTPNSFQLIFTLLFSLILGFIAVSVISYQGTKEYVIDNALNQSLPLISDNIYSEIKKELLDPINTSSLMANDTFLISWLEDGEVDVNEIQQYLATISDHYGYTSAFLVSNQTRNYYYYGGVLKQVSSTDLHDIWYYKFIQLNQSMELDVDVDEASAGKLTIFINHRLENESGDFLGVTGIGLELSNVSEKLLEYENKYMHEIYLVDHDGIIQVHANQDFVERKNLLDRKAITEIDGFSLDIEDQIQVYKYVEHSESRAISIRYIPEFDWFLIVENNQSHSLASAKIAMWKNILIGVVVTAIVAALLLGNFKMYYQRLEVLATTDDLSQMYNRRYFTELFEREISIANRYNKPLSLLMLDIDNFKEINEIYGHLVGDKMLRHISDQIRSSVRNSDIVGRWGGEEFVILLINTDIEVAAQTAERIRASIASSELGTEKGIIKRTVSIGVSTLTVEINSDDEMTHVADNALYEAKRLGKNRVVFK